MKFFDPSGVFRLQVVSCGSRENGALGLCVIWGQVCREVVIVGTVLAGLWEA